MSIITRRSFLRGLFAAPAIVAASSLMPISIKALVDPRGFRAVGDDTAFLQGIIDEAARTGRPALIPPGMFRISKTLIVPQNVMVSGSGGDTWIKNETPRGVPLFALDQGAGVENTGFKSSGGSVRFQFNPVRVDQS